MALSPALMMQIAIAYGYVAFWIAASAGVILFNKCAPTAAGSGVSCPHICVVS